MNVYFGVHPATRCKRQHERATLSDIAAVNCLFAEFDAKDFDGGKPAALAHMDTLIPTSSVVVDSGGGYHCYWLLPVPFILDTDAAYMRVRSVQSDWVAFVGGDPGAKDLARVLRVSGTRNLKYDHQPPATIVRADLSRLYDLDTLEALLPVQAATPPHRNNGGNGKSAWAEAALADELAILARTHEGQRNEQLNRSAFAMGQVVGGGHLDRARVERALSATALGIGLTARSRGQMDAHAVGKMLKRRGKQAGCTGPVNAHSFRHGFARSYLTNGGDLGTLSKILGHSSVAVTVEYYAIFNADELQRQHAKYSPISRLENGENGN